jgi:hypothetical protein
MTFMFVLRHHGPISSDKQDYRKQYPLCEAGLVVGLSRMVTERPSAIANPATRRKTARFCLIPPNLQDGNGNGPPIRATLFPLEQVAVALVESADGAPKSGRMLGCFAHPKTRSDARAP